MMLYSVTMHDNKDISLPDSPYMASKLSAYPEELDLLLSCSKPKQVVAGKTVYVRGEESQPEFYFIESGSVKHSVFGKNGSEKILTILEKNNVFGYAAALDRYPYFTTATALENTVLRVVDVPNFRRLVERHPKISFMVMESLAQILRIFMLHIEDSSFLNAQSRVAHMLYKLALEAGQKTSKGMLISKKLTQQDLASLAGVSRVSVSLTLNYFENLDILRKKRHSIEVFDVGRLKRIAGEDKDDVM
jgi:CRP/FNR family transcriptional regulator, cyclic AMP receptor protein